MISSLPLALGIALSPFAIMPAVLVLLGSRPRAAGYAFASAWWCGVTAVALVAGSLAFAAPSDDKPLWAALLRVAVGVALLVAAVVKWRGRAAAKQPAWLGSLADASPGAAARLALLLTVANPKVIMLAAAGGASIGATAPTVAAELAAIAVFALVASMTALAPVLAFTVAGERTAPVLEAVRRWLDAHTSAVIAVVSAVIGLLVLVSGLSGL
ncbi:GAP family protein [Demequina silvatica]|uniref:GAP family protein n=1 Tax=Demequina silvatica TaxID=1638988 RepID=UPI000A5E2827|nr:GAP family protein [Demequina silvatica]